MFSLSPVPTLAPIRNRCMYRFHQPILTLVCP